MKSFVLFLRAEAKYARMNAVCASQLGVAALRPEEHENDWQEGGILSGKVAVPPAVLKSRGYHSVLNSFRVYLGVCVCVVVWLWMGSRDASV